MCVFCGQPFPDRDSLGFRALCPGCGRELHACAQCVFYKPGAHYDCLEHVQECVFDKERANRCEWWRPATIAAKGGKPADPSAAPTKKDARSSFEDLFK